MQRNRARNAIIFIVIATILGVATTLASGQESNLRRQIIDAGMAPWSGRPIDLDDDTLRGSNREKISLRNFIGKPILAYNYAQW